MAIPGQRTTHPFAGTAIFRDGWDALVMRTDGADPWMKSATVIFASITLPETHRAELR